MYLYLEGGPNSGLSKTWEREVDEYIERDICIYIACRHTLTPQYCSRSAFVPRRARNISISIYMYIYIYICMYVYLMSYYAHTSVLFPL